MNTFSKLIAGMVFMIGLLPLQAPGNGSLSGKFLLLTIDGPIGPATADYVVRGMGKAERFGASLVIIQIDTPGGLDTSMRDIIQKILASTIPVVVYVSPSGARAASAGTYILYASHIAVMAPATNLGAATPVPLGSPGPESGPEEGKEKSPGKDNKSAMEKKAVNDAVAYIRSLAQMRGRNVAWAEQAVREAASLPAEEAVKQNIADFIAKDMRELIAQLDGRKVHVLGQEMTLKTGDLKPERFDPDWRSRLLSVITDPNVIPILMMLGMFGLMYELFNPGFVLPGVIGGICLLLALYAVQVLPINYAGLALLLLGIMFMVAEAFVPSFGALGFGGVIAFIAGSIMLLETDVEGYTVSWPLISATAVVGALLIAGIANLALRARDRKVQSGMEEMIGATGEVLADFTQKGTIRVHSELWTARSAVPLAAGDKVKVTGIDGLVLQVKPFAQEGN